MTFGYIDAGSGSLLIQLLVGGLAGVATFLRFRWTTLRNRGREKSSAVVEAGDLP